MTALGSLPASGALFPLAKPGDITPYNYDLAADLAGRTKVADLADNATATKGAALVKFNSALGYAAGTVGAFLNSLLASAGSSLIGFIRSESGAIVRSVQDKLRDIASVKDFAAKGDGVTDDTAAITAADALTGRKYLPTGTYLTTLAATAFNGPFWGEGQIKDSAGNKRAPYLSAIKAAPTASGNFNDISTAFNGSLSGVLFPIEHRVTGTTTLGSPTTGYLYTPEAGAYVVVSRNDSGHNESTSTNIGRTACVVNFGKLDQFGQGDHTYFAIQAQCGGSSRAGATDFLANPAVCAFDGTFTATGHGIYLNWHECDLELGVYDAAAIGHVVSVTRNTGDTGPGLGSVTGGFRTQSKGTYPVDWAVSATGLMKTLTDATQCEFGTNKSAHVIKSGDRIYFNGVSTDGRRATSLGTDFVQRTAGGIDFYFNNAAAFRASDTGAGYLAGAGGAVTQLTSKATSVTLNKVCGQITLNNAALAATTIVSFTLTNSTIAVDDDVRVWVKSGNASVGSYRVAAEGNAAGSRTIVVENKTAGSLSEAIVLGFNVLKAVVS